MLPSIFCVTSAKVFLSLQGLQGVSRTGIAAMCHVCSLSDLLSHLFQNKKGHSANTLSSANFGRELLANKTQKCIDKS